MMNNEDASEEISSNLFLVGNSSGENSPTPLQDISLPSEFSSLSNSYNSQNNESYAGRAHEPPANGILRGSADVIYEGGLEDNEEIEYKVLLDEPDNNDALDHDGDEVEIEVRGTKYKIPYAIECHLCNEMMNLCLRRTRYRGESREYPAYRCNRKGCQTFRSIRKVFSNISGLKKLAETPSHNISLPALKETPKSKSDHPVLQAGISENDKEEFIVQRVYFPKHDNRNTDRKTASVTDRMRKANQERATVFSEFADQLRRDIAANKRVRTRKQINEESEQQGTLFYISKELSPQEIIELQDTILKTLISLRKIPPPMTMHDLPVFANCPYSKKDLESGLVKSQSDFWAAFTSSPQPPIPIGFTRKKDDSLIYRDPKPYEVPDILQENSPRKQADSVVNYLRRKEQQDARRMEKRHVEKKCRSWAALKREFDMAEVDERPMSKMSKGNYDDSNHERQPRHVTLRELMHKMDDNSTGQLTCRIRASSSDQSVDSMQWIDSNTPRNTGEMSQEPANDDYPEQEINLEDEDNVFNADSKFKESSSSMQDMMRTLSVPTSLRSPISPMMKSFTSMDNGSMKNSMNPQTPLFFQDPNFFSSNPHMHNSSYYTMNPFVPPYPMASMIDSNLLYHNRDISEDHYQCIGGTEVVRTDSAHVPPFTYIHPDSGARLTDPSAFLNSFIPSPITKIAPMNFNEEGSRPRRSSEPSTSTMHSIDVFNDTEEKDEEGAVENKEILDSYLKFDPPQIDD